jgi:hypothetical protein
LVSPGVQRPASTKIILPCCWRQCVFSRSAMPQSVLLQSTNSGCFSNAIWCHGYSIAAAMANHANYYQSVAQFARCFLALERDSFAVES